MPIYIQLCSLVVPKEVLKTKYAGGIIQFKEDYSFDRSDLHQEDELLISIAYMNPDEIEIELLVERGLSFQEFPNPTSKDFVIITRYGGVCWANDSITTNSVYVWHKNTPRNQIKLAQNISTKFMDVVLDELDNGINPYPLILPDRL
jgi:hypothetical protein